MGIGKMLFGVGGREDENIIGFFAKLLDRVAFFYTELAAPLVGVSAVGGGVM